MKNLFLLVALLFTVSINAQIPGTWTTYDEDTNEATSLIKLEVQEDGSLSGKIIKLFREPDAICSECDGDLKNIPLLGLRNVWGFSKSNDQKWTGGNILDPRNGKVYSCKLTLKDDNTLKVRGYIGTPMLGKTKIWKRAK